MTKKEIRSIMAPLTEGFMLLPGSVVAEVLAYTPPEPFKEAPDWLLGELVWHGWQVPVISFVRLIDENSGTSKNPDARILIIKTLGESTQVNYIGLIIQGLPKLKKISASLLIEKQTTDLPTVIFSKVEIDDQSAFIPEMAVLTQIVEKAAYGNQPAN